MPTYARYDPNTDEISVQNMEPSAFDAHCTFWEIPELTDPNSLYIVGADLLVRPPAPGEDYYFREDLGQWFAYPPQPNGYCVFDEISGTWSDPRSQADYDGALHQARLAAAIPTQTLLRRLAEPDTDTGRPAAYGMDEVANFMFPPTFEEFLGPTRFTQVEHDLIKGGLRTWAVIPRSETRIEGPIHPDDPGDGLPDFTSWLTSEKGITITSEHLDEIFEVDVPPPLYTGGA